MGGKFSYKGQINKYKSMRYDINEMSCFEYDKKKINKKEMQS